MDRKQVRAFEAFVSESGDALLRTATLLTSDRHAAEDVYQETLQRLFVRWSRVGNPAGFCRQVMHNLVIDQARARQRRPRELELLDCCDGKDPRSGDPASAAELRPAVLAATGLPTTRLPPLKLTAEQVLNRLSVAAARAPQSADRYIALTENDGFYVRTIVFDGLTGDVWAYQHGGSEPGSIVPGKLPPAVHMSPTRAEFAAWPTNPASLRTLLLSPKGQATAEGEVGAEGITGETSNDMVFQEATMWLWNPLLSPALRAGMYKVLAATPGVQVKTGVTDKTGRPAIEISRQDTITGDRFTTFESPSTGAVLEQDFSYVSPAVYTAVTGYATPPANPYSGG